MEINPQYAALLPVLIGLLQALKTAGFNPRYIPTLSISAGVLIGLFLYNFDPIQGVTFGGALGLAAIGAHSGIKNTLKK